ncbi:PepSY domain-containing protein [Bacillaceae bacterium Marseille-Q3522]|nr:PepSY domain-containing protein [Bacillaceae bacterium Marseille-Q3522]
MKTIKRSRLLIGALALTLMATTALGSTTAFAANASSNPPQASAASNTDTSPNVPSDSAEPENEVKDAAKEAAENAALASKATVTEQEAIQIAQEANTGYTFTVAELGNENGVIAYDLKGSDAAGKTLDVHVDANSGAIIQNSDSQYGEQDTDESEADEAKDPAKEAAENAALAAKATVTEQEAIQIAQEANTGYTFTVAELGNENGVIAYDLKGSDTAGKTLNVHVDANSGAIIQESDSEHED